MYKYYGKVYKVFITFDKKLLEIKDGIKNFMKKEFAGIILDDREIEDVGIKLISLEGNKLELLWYVPDGEGSHEIENDLFYTLEQGKYGIYSYEYVS